MENAHFVYLLECADNTFYCGYTNDVTARVKTHNAKKGAKYTRCRTPVFLVYQEEFSDKGDALRREIAIKKLSRKQKEELIIQYNRDKISK